MHGKILLKQSCSIEKKCKNCAWSKVFLSHFHKVLLKQMCFGQYLICARINSTKTLCFGKKKTARTVLDQKCVCNIFIKFYSNLVNILICSWKHLTKTMCFCSNIYKVLLKEMCFVNILICTCKNSTKTLCFGRKKQQELYLIKSVSGTFL